MAFVTTFHKRKRMQHDLEASAFRRAQRFRNKYEDEFTSRFKSAMENIREKITPAQVQRAMNNHDPALLTRMVVDEDLFPVLKIQKAGEFLSYEEYLDLLMAQLIEEKAKLEIDILLQRLRAAGGPSDIKLSFTLDNPYTVDFVRTHRLELVREIGDSTREAIRTALQQAIEEGLGPREAARRMRNSIGLTTNQLGTVAAQEQRLIESGVTGRKLEAAMESFYQRKISDRATLIARTEIIRAESEGQVEAWKIAQDAGHLGQDARKKWVASPGDGRTDPICEGLHELDPVPLGESFDLDGELYDQPPAHPGCRCSLIIDEASLYE